MLRSGDEARLYASTPASGAGLADVEAHARALAETRVTVRYCSFYDTILA